MKKFLLAGLFVVIAACGGANGSESPSSGPAADPAVEAQRGFSLELADGSTYTLAESGNPAFVIFWAEW
jgi:hypothetical protein